ncbi:MAG: DJ-1/PfpI family protein [Myxococcaceae bacterium]
MARVAVIIDKHFEDRDLRTLRDGLRDARQELIPVGLRADWTVEGRHGHERVTTEAAPKDVDPDATDGLIIPSGYTQTQLLSHHEVLLNLARDVYARGKPVGAVSSAGWIILGPDPTHGSHMTSWPSVKRDLLNVDADWRDVDLLEHENVRYSQRPGDVTAFVAAFDEALAEVTRIERVYGPAPSAPSHAVD